MSYIVATNPNQPVYIGSGAKHPLAANLGDIVLCDDCRAICFSSQTSSVADALDIRTRKTICIGCQTKDNNAIQVEYIN